MGVPSLVNLAPAVLTLLLANPTVSVATAEPLLLDLTVTAEDLQAPLLAAADLGGETVTAATANTRVPLSRALLDLYDAFDLDLSHNQQARMMRTARSLDPTLQAALAPLVVAMAASHRLAATELVGINAGELRAACDERDPLGPNNVALADQLDRAPFVNGGLKMLAAAETALPLLHEAKAPRAAPFALDPHGLVVVAGEANSRVPAAATSALLYVDLGGDDTYRGATGSAGCVAGPGPIDFTAANSRLFIDLDGDDFYQAPEESHHSQGTGHHAVGVHIDVAGDDRYFSLLFGIGYGETAGVGIVVDLDGTDLYALSAWGQGAGTLEGIGILADGGGSDRYTGFEGIHVGKWGQQGVGMFSGVGLLLDAGGGGDRYRTREAAGIDCKCQGASYDFGVGVLVDRGGNDYYGTNRGRATVILGGATAQTNGGAAYFLDLGGLDSYNGTSSGDNNDVWGRGIGATFIERGQDCAPPATPCTIL